MLLAEIAQTTAGLAMREELATKLCRKRALLAKALDCHNATSDVARKPLVDKRRAADASVRIVERQLETAKIAQYTAASAAAAHASDADRIRAAHERAMLDAAGPELANFLDRISAEVDKLSDVRRIEETPVAVSLGYSMEAGHAMATRYRTNFPQVAARIEALAELRRIAIQRASTIADYAIGFETLWNGLPNTRMLETA